MVYPHPKVRGIWDMSERGVRSWSIHILRYGDMGQECERCKIMVYPHTQVRMDMGQDKKSLR